MKLKKSFPDVETSLQGRDFRPVRPVTGMFNPFFSPAKAPKKDVLIEVPGRTIILKLPKNEQDTKFITSLRFSRWSKKLFCWIVPNYPGNLDLIADHFKDRVSELIIHDRSEDKQGIPGQNKIRPNELLIIKTGTQRLKLIFVSDMELISIVKKMPFSHWDPDNKWWTIPYSDKLLQEIKDSARAIGFDISYEEEQKSEERAKRISPVNEVDFRPCPEEYLRKLKELRYSHNTLKTYKVLFEEFINYYNKHDIALIDEKMIIAFLQYLVLERKISLSYQNQSINAIKFYYERVLKGDRKIYSVERPRREKTLPVVLNETEILRTIKLVSNIKHKAIIMLIYSSGLRLSEVINMKIKDIDSERMQVFVRQAKGKKDRYTLLSHKILPMLRQYFEEYKPKEWLFEGARGEQYSSSSVQTIVSEAFQRAGITKKATTHTLRHCFATHLLEHGTDLRYIQKLLGHESVKTTEIYTHVTTKGFDQIKNPLDSMELD